MPTDRFDEAVCAVCARSATGVAVQNRGRRLLWVCDDLTCLRDARNSADMKQNEWSGRERVAARLGAQDAGEYLAEIGVSSFADLTEEQWNEMWRRGIAGYRRHLKSAVQTDAPF